MANGYGNGNDGNDKMDPLSWLDRFERAQEIQNKQIGEQNKQLGELTSSVSALTATVGTIDSQQKALFGRANRPYPWGALVGGLSLIGICAGLLVAPINVRLTAQETATLLQQEHSIQNAREIGTIRENLRWQDKLEERLNSRIHSTLKIKD